MSRVRAILATRYAQAFFETFPSDLSNDVINKLKQVVHFFSQQKRLLCMPFISCYSKNRLHKTLSMLLLNDAELPYSFGKLINVLLDDRRAVLLPSVLEQIVRIYYEQNNIYSFCIASSHPLDDFQIESLKKFIAYKLNSTIMVTYQEDESLIAGIRLQSTLYVWEYSIRKSLETIHNTVMNKVRYG